jgi:hypothetical protein
VLSAQQVLNSLPPKFDTHVVTLEENKELSQFSLDELQYSLINHENKLNRSNKNKDKISQATKIVPPILHLWHALKQCL